jgi:hypothetical protein
LSRRLFRAVRAAIVTLPFHAAAVGRWLRSGWSLCVSALTCGCQQSTEFYDTYSSPGDEHAPLSVLYAHRHGWSSPSRISSTRMSCRSIRALESMWQCSCKIQALEPERASGARPSRFRVDSPNSVPSPPSVTDKR